jgi:hypothetical protein
MTITPNAAPGAVAASDSAKGTTPAGVDLTTPGVGGVPGPGFSTGTGQNGQSADKFYGSVRESELRAAAEFGIAKGRITREEANALLAEQGVDVGTTEAAPEIKKFEEQREAPKEEPGEGEIEVPADFDPPAASPTDYRLPNFRDNQALNAITEATPGELRVNELSRTWLHKAEFSRGSGSNFAQVLVNEAKRLSTLDSVQAEFHAKSDLARFNAKYGDQAETKLNLARQLVREIEASAPGLIHFLDTSRAGNSRFVIELLANQAEKLKMRKGR